MKFDRRDILKLAALGSGLLFCPSLVKTAKAEPRPDAPAKRVLILNLLGGVRSSAAFYASTQTKYNPYGVIEGAGSRFALGKLLDDHLAGGAVPTDADYTLGAAWKNERVPRLREIAKDFSILGTWDPERGDHVRARLMESTGSSAGDQPGILTRYAAALTKERGPLDVLPFQLAPASGFGQAANLARFAPVSLTSAKSLPVPSKQSSAELKATGNDWARDDAMRERLDQNVIAHRARNAKSTADVFAAHRRASRQIGARLAEPWVNVGKESYGNATFGTVEAGGAAVPLTNAMLVELFKKTVGAKADEEYEDEGSDQAEAAMNAALALRLLQLGSPAVCLEIDGFDTHSAERTEAPALYRFVGRLWATLNWVMKRIPDPQIPGRSLFDTTLILTMSDFSRDPGTNGKGFNGGEGSDHGSDPSCYYLAHAVMGGGVQPNRIISEVSTNDYRGDRAAEKFDQRALLAMTFWALGLDPNNPEWALDGVNAPLDALFRV